MRNQEKTIQENQIISESIDSSNLPYFQQIKILLPKLYAPKKDRHYNLQELREIANNIKNTAKSFKLPEHLFCCKECMETLLVILEGIRVQPPQTLSRYYSIYKQTTHYSNLFLFPRWRLIAAIAASILIILLPLPIIYQRLADIPIEIHSGILQPEGMPLSHNNFLSQNNKETSIKRGMIFTALKPSVAKMYDGITVTIDENSKLAMNRSFFCDFIELKNGGIFVAVPPREKRKTFKVETKFGEVIVRGTIFRVEILESNEEISDMSDQYEDSSKNGVVVVTVEHGTVTVKNDASSLDVKEGYQALIKSPKETIAVSKSTLLPRHF